MLPPSLLHKVLSVAGVSGLASTSANSHPFASPIPWRKAGVRYNNNEILFDVTETLEAIVNKCVLLLGPCRGLLNVSMSLRNGQPAVSTVWGRVDSNCKLSGTFSRICLSVLSFHVNACAGTPDLLLTFSNAQSLNDCSFHPCVRCVTYMNSSRSRALTSHVVKQTTEMVA